MNTATKTAENRTVQENQRANDVTPLANILERADGYDLQAEMPGVNREGLEVTVDKGMLTITGKRVPRPVKGRELFRETRPTDYRRVFELDPSIDAERITARIDQGLMTMHLPKAERVKPRKIEVG